MLHMSQDVFKSRTFAVYWVSDMSSGMKGRTLAQNPLRAVSVGGSSAGLILSRGTKEPILKPSKSNSNTHSKTKISSSINPKMAGMNGHMLTVPALSNPELDIHLEWPDSEALLQSIVTFDWDSLTLPPGSIVTPQAHQQAAPQPNAPSVVQSADGEDNQDPDQLSPVNGSRDAIQSLSDMVTCLSQNVTTAAKSLPELNPAFLDSCLQAYFSHFNIYFPIPHRPTFVYRDCSPSLILNAIALGSLFIGTEDALKGRKDLKLTSQVFHSLGFNWANQNNISRPRSFQQSPGEISEECAWKQWAADEVYHRALVGHYILDGQLSYLSGQPGTATLYAANTLRLSASSKAYEARDPQE
ncbi:C2H2 type zinc finger domain [Fusarium agapanthi]|uniref:C2H2 type zinc finger domain n=1 Tax=Fusarium agapanthi TaxID=1803897 RepID=A0A9P5B949_9HYPO|nr:C2H2 type zinc finger domain [Fusarium agapanthi]